jgi:hypothetical protein
MSLDIDDGDWLIEADLNHLAKVFIMVLGVLFGCWGFYCFEKGSHCVPHDGLKLSILLLQSPALKLFFLKWPFGDHCRTRMNWHRYIQTYFRKKKMPG